MVIEVNCDYCNKKLTRLRNPKTKSFCNASCQMRYAYANGIRNKNTIANKAHAEIRRKSLEKFKSNPTTMVGKRGYLMIYIPQKGNQPYHQYVWEQHNGVIPKGYHIHHIDENKLNNDIKNLELMTESDHHKYHVPERNMLGQFIPKQISTGV